MCILSKDCLGDGGEEQDQVRGGGVFGSSLALSGYRFKAGPAMDKLGPAQDRGEQVQNQNNALGCRDVFQCIPIRKREKQQRRGGGDCQF